jgi:vacuolar-type H+-ATPase subunit H
MSESTHAPAPVQNVEALKQVREVERQSEARVAKLRADVDAAILRLGEEAEAAVRTARTDGEAAREAALADARTKADVEAAGIVAEGRKLAQLIELKATQTVAAKRDQVLGIVLGEFKGGA